MKRPQNKNAQSQVTGYEEATQYERDEAAIQQALTFKGRCAYLLTHNILTQITDLELKHD